MTAVDHWLVAHDGPRRAFVVGPLSWEPQQASWLPIRARADSSHHSSSHPRHWKWATGAGNRSGLVFSAAGSEAGLLQEALDPLQDLWLIDAVGEARAGAVPVDHKRVHRQNGRPVQHRAARITKAQATLVGLSWVAGQLQVEALRVAALEADELDSGLQPLDLGDLDRPHV